LNFTEEKEVGLKLIDLQIQISLQQEI
jgi:hypothetical protein